MVNDPLGGMSTRMQRTSWMDGIEEISLGLWFLVAGLLFSFLLKEHLVESAIIILPFILLVTVWAYFIPSKYLKRAFSHPRIGYVKPKPQPFFPYGLLGLALQLPIAFVIFSQLDYQPWHMLYWLWMTQSIITGLASKYLRFFFYALAGGLLLWLNVEICVFLLTIGMVSLTVGLVVFLKFMRTYPVIEEENINA